jgi:hypothetical protein
MTSGIYAIVNTTTGKTYVGSAYDIQKRWMNRRSELRRGKSKNKALQTDWEATQGAGFELRVLEITESDDATLMTAEDRWIATLRATAAGVYNQKGAIVGRHGAHNRGPRKGWGRALGKQKTHYFVRARHSLCSNAVRDELCALEDANHESPSNCKRCRKEREVLAAAKRARWAAYIRKLYYRNRHPTGGTPS